MAHPGTNPVRSGMDDLIPRPSGSKFNAHTTRPPSRRIVESLSVNGFSRKYPTVNWHDSYDNKHLRNCNITFASEEQTKTEKSLY